MASKTLHYVGGIGSKYIGNDKLDFLDLPVLTVYVCDGY